jgi:hypothetical protein
MPAPSGPTGGENPVPGQNPTPVENPATTEAVPVAAPTNLPAATTAPAEERTAAAAPRATGTAWVKNACIVLFFGCVVGGVAVVSFVVGLGVGAAVASDPTSFGLAPGAAQPSGHAP